MDNHAATKIMPTLGDTSADKHDKLYNKIAS